MKPLSVADALRVVNGGGQVGEPTHIVSPDEVELSQSEAVGRTRRPTEWGGAGRRARLKLRALLNPTLTPGVAGEQRASEGCAEFLRANGVAAELVIAAFCEASVRGNFSVIFYSFSPDARKMKI